MANGCIDQWIQLNPGERWVAQPGNQIALQSRQIGRTSCGNLAKVINIMAAAVEHMAANDVTSGNLSRLLELAETKVITYTSRRCCIYRLFLKIIGCDPQAALKRLSAAVANRVAAIQTPMRASSGQEPSKSSGLALPSGSELSRIPQRVDAAVFKELYEHKKFKSLASQEQRLHIAAYIHLLVLKTSLEITNQEIVDAIFDEESTGFRFLNCGNNANPVMFDGFLRLLKQKRSLCLPTDGQKICDFFQETKLSKIFYHGTNLVAFQHIQKVGLGAASREYSLKEVRTVHQRAEPSALNLDRFWVTPSSCRAYGYAAVSPEWVYVANKVPSEIKKRYDDLSEVVLLQIEMPGDVKPIWWDLWEQHLPEQFGRPQFFSGHLEGLLTGEKDDHPIEGCSFAPVKILAFIVPKLSAEINTKT